MATVPDPETNHRPAVRVLQTPPLIKESRTRVSTHRARVRLPLERIPPRSAQGHRVHRRKINRRETKRRGEWSDITYSSPSTITGRSTAPYGGSGAEIINHSCEPNLYAWNFKKHILYMSKRLIRPGEELTIDYRFDTMVERVPCLCGATNCRGTINLLEVDRADSYHESSCASQPTLLALVFPPPASSLRKAPPSLAQQDCRAPPPERSEGRCLLPCLRCPARPRHAFARARYGREYIAAQFRRRRLWNLPATTATSRRPLTIGEAQSRGSCGFSLGSVTAADGAVTIQEAAATRSAERSGVQGVSGRHRRARIPHRRSGSRQGPAGRSPARTAGADFRRSAACWRRRQTGAGLVVIVRPAPSRRTARRRRAQLRDAALPGSPSRRFSPSATRRSVRCVAAAKTGPLDPRVSVHIAAPLLQAVKVRNVAGLLRGTDPALKDTFVIVTGHYDHLGMRPNAVAATASTTAPTTMPAAPPASSKSPTRFTAIGEKPRRSILFITVFGEEIGGLGARWYTSHPIFPGRQDDRRYQSRTTRAAPTIWRVPTSPSSTSPASTTPTSPRPSPRPAPETGVQVVKHPTKSDSFFGAQRQRHVRRRRASLPPHSPSATNSPTTTSPATNGTSSTTTTWPKSIRTVALGILAIANSDQVPQWNKENPKTARYVQAREK